MLLELVGEEDFNRRLQAVITKYPYSSVSSRQFIRQFCGDNKLLQKFFDKWIYSRAIPVIKMELAEKDKEFDKKEHKTIVLKISQLNTDFVFPFKVRISTDKGTTEQDLVMSAPTQRFVFHRKETIRTITLKDSVSPIKEKVIATPRSIK